MFNFIREPPSVGACTATPVFCLQFSIALIVAHNVHAVSLPWGHGSSFSSLTIQQTTSKHWASVRVMEHKPQAVASTFEKFKKQATGGDSRSMAREGDVKSFSAYAARPMATNSRLRKDEKYKRDIYLAFIDNAFAQKAKVRLHTDVPLLRL